ncbi:PIR Superfamily Protein [Plasmodium ovale curtisi]|uniref:PIR Superfamily Protein n=1 Tax=Plasmodium ovale curtisi TaxID=864141 RepID=A0A1A8WFJ1_PLAOA|nr:PIR Superfamily Protein [Plasmodium ovale curtisi]
MEDYSLSILNSNIFYEKLNTASEDYSDKSTAFWNSNIKNTCIKKTGIFDTLLKGFYYVSYMKNDVNFYNNRWYYLYFWGGSKVFENTGCTFLEMMYVLQSVKRHIDQAEYSYNIYNISENEFKDLKIAFEYIVNYDSIKHNIHAYNFDCTEKYKKYVDSSFEVYNKLRDECQLKASEEFCKFFTNFAQTNKSENLEKLTCHGKMPPLSVEQYKSKLSEHTDQEDKVKGEIHTEETSPFSVSDNMMSTYFPVLGIFSILFLLYNLTPFRSWLRNIVSKKQINRPSVYEDQNDEFFENTYELSDTNIHCNRHDLSFHSFINS